MKTGEGKTLTTILPAYLNALSGEGVHIVTVNEYLAGRDASWMGQIYEFLFEARKKFSAHEVFPLADKNLTTA